MEANYKVWKVLKGNFNHYLRMFALVINYLFFCKGYLTKAIFVR